MLYLSINGTIDPTLTNAKFKQVFKNDPLNKAIDLSSEEQLTQKESENIESELAKLLNSNQTSDNDANITWNAR